MTQFSNHSTTIIQIIMVSHLFKALLFIAVRMLLISGLISGLIGSVLAWLSYNRLKGLGERSVSNSSISICLHHSPNKIKGIDLILLSFSILLKYIPGTKGYGNRLRADKQSDQKFQLPLIEVKGKVEFDENDLKRFQKAVQLSHLTTNLQESAKNNLFLIALTAPLTIFILAQHDCPIKPLGAVNTQNSFHFQDPKACRDIEDLLNCSKGGKLSYIAVFGGKDHPGIRKKRGMEFNMTITIKKGDKPILTQNLSFLQFLKSSVKPRFDINKQEKNTIEQNAEIDQDVGTCALPRLDVTSPRLWAASCGDYNPIHILPAAAILFGFPSVIAHGNHVVSLAVESVLDDNQFERAREILFGLKPFKLDVQFIKPMVLPSTLYVAWQEKSHQSVSLVVLRGDKPCVIGSCYKDV